MAKFRKKPVVIEAVQWNKDGDHPAVVPIPEPVLATLDERGIPDLPDGVSLADIRWIGTLESGHIVIPGDWIIKGVAGELYPCKADVFAASYEPAE